MKKCLLLISVILLAWTSTDGQVAINETGIPPHNSAMLDVESATKGFLAPRMKSSDMNAIISPAIGLLIYNTTEGVFYNFNGTTWTRLVSGSSTLLQDANKDTKIEVEKTTNEDIIRFSTGGSEYFNMNHGRLNVLNTGNSVFIGNNAGASDDLNNRYNVFIGSSAGNFNTSGFNNVGVGAFSLLNNDLGRNNAAFGTSSMLNNLGGKDNTAMGAFSLYLNNSGYSNVAIGTNALRGNVAGHNLVAIGDSALCKQNAGATANLGNTAIGSKAMFENTVGYFNTAEGFNALYSNTDGHHNTALGYEALASNNGSANTAVGLDALYHNTTGNNNVAVGYAALFSNTEGSGLVAIGDSALYAQAAYPIYMNTAVGKQALSSNTTGNGNTATGWHSLKYNVTGVQNTAVGINALQYTNSNHNTSVGAYAGDLYSFTAGTFLGAYAYPNTNGYTNCMALGYSARVDASNKAVIGNVAVSSIGGYAGWTTFPSDRSFKKNVSENVPGIAFIGKLRPVTYNVDVTAINESLSRFDQQSGKKRNQSTQKEAEEQAAIRAKEQVVYTGFIAQEVEEAAKTVGYDFSGVDAPKDANGHYGLRYGDFVVPLVKAVQEQQSLIERLEKRLTLLEKQNDELTKRLESIQK